jgi:N-ethylmaleimide reductase
MMTDTTDNPTKLLSPIRIGPYELPNRVVMAPMTRNRAGNEGVPTELNALYYAQRASAGLIISEASPISPQGVGYPGTPGIYTSAQVEGWKRVTDAVHEKGGRIFIQLWHVGRISHPSLQPGQSLPIAPSAIRPQGEAFTATGLQPFVTPRAAEKQDIMQVVEDFAAATQNAQSAGFDGVEVHAANGYLLDQFLRDGTNHRDDEYGGSIENRCRLLIQVLEAVVNAWGGDYVGVRLSPLNPFNDISDSDPQALFSHLVTQLDKWNLAYLHMVEGTLQGMDLTDQSFDLTTLKSLINAPYMANGGYTRERAELAISSVKADLVSFGEPYIANPDLVRRFELDSPLNEADPSTYYGGGSEGYTDYPALADDAG